MWEIRKSNATNIGICSWSHKNKESIEPQIRDNIIDIDAFKTSKEANLNSMVNWTQLRSWDKWKKASDASCFGWNTGMHLWSFNHIANNDMNFELKQDQIFEVNENSLDYWHSDSDDLNSFAWLDKWNDLFS